MRVAKQFGGRVVGKSHRHANGLRLAILVQQPDLSPAQAAAVALRLHDAIELLLLAANVNFVAFSHYLEDLSGQVFVFFVLTVAAAEAAIGLAILIVLFRTRRSINVQDLDRLKG